VGGQGSPAPNAGDLVGATSSGGSVKSAAAPDAAGSALPGPGSDSGPAATRHGSRNSAPAAASAPPAAAAVPAVSKRAPSSGLAAARAAAAGAGRGTNTAAAGKASAFADGSPAEEAPYDPEYDGPPRPAGAGSPDRGGAAFEGFDPGDEPLDDVIDEKTARQSSEQQAVQLLRDALGAEKISES
jgi:DNA polymerase-3 subunit gamma/tau